MIIAPLPTPFASDGQPDWRRLAGVVDALAPHVDAFLLYGSTGESVCMTPAEKVAGLDAVRFPKPFMVGVIEESLPPALAFAAAARDAGAFALLVTPPRYYGGGARPEVATAYYEALADIGPEVWLYHVPQYSRVDLSLDVVRALAAHPRITGIKDSSGVLGRIAFYRSQALDLRVFTGHAPTVLGALALGAEGGILAAANVAPIGYRALLDAHVAGDRERAAALQCALEPLGRTLAADGVALVKTALGHLGIDAGIPRPPHPAIAADDARAADLLAVVARLRTDGLTVGGTSEP